MGLENRKQLQFLTLVIGVNSVEAGPCFSALHQPYHRTQRVLLIAWVVPRILSDLLLVREVLSFSKKRARHVGAIKIFICPYNLTGVAA